MTENELSNIIIGEAINVHQRLGPGLLESVYETCLVHRLFKVGLAIECQKPIPLFFEEVRLECGFRCDILVDNKVIIEVKAVEALNDIHLAQVLTYLRLSEKMLGLLMNFNVIKLKDGIKGWSITCKRKVREEFAKYRKVYDTLCAPLRYLAFFAVKL